MSDKQTLKVLSHLASLVEAGERGYAVSAANLDNPGLKILFKSFAQQRAKFKAEIFAEIQRLGGNAKPRSSIRGVIHRGRIDIFASMTIGKAEREKVVLKEVMLGEKVAVRTYERALKLNLPSQTHQFISQQYEQLKGLVEQIRQIQGRDGKRMIVKLLDREEEAVAALKTLKDNGFQPNKVEQINIQKSLELYTGRGTTVLETSLSGAVGGAMWGGLMGGLGGFGAQQTASLVPFDGALIQQSAWPFLSLVVGIVAGALFGAILGFVIGIGISEEDSYQHEQSMKRGQILLLAVVEISQAPEVQRIISQIEPIPQIAEVIG